MKIKYTIENMALTMNFRTPMISHVFVCYHRARDTSSQNVENFIKWIRSVLVKH